MMFTRRRGGAEKRGFDAEFAVTCAGGKTGDYFGSR